MPSPAQPFGFPLPLPNWEGSGGRRVRARIKIARLIHLTIDCSAMHIDSSHTPSSKNLSCASSTLYTGRIYSYWLFGTLHGRPGMWGCFAGFTRKTPPHFPFATRNPKDPSCFSFADYYFTSKIDGWQLLKDFFHSDRDKNNLYLL